jgi:NADH:ubiquinone oxidoreductase subunit E
MNETIKLTICMGSSCFSKGNKNNLMVIQDYLKLNNLNDRVDFRGSLCMGQCKSGPNLVINQTTYHQISSENIFDILENELNKLKNATDKDQ